MCTMMKKFGFIRRNFSSLAIKDSPNLTIFDSHSAKFAHEGPQNMAELAEKQFRMHILRHDQCLTRVNEFRAQWSLEESKNCVLNRTPTANMSFRHYCAPIFINSLLRSLLEYDHDSFENVIGNRLEFYLPLLELIADQNMTFPFEDFITILSFCILLKERLNLTLPCLTSRLILEAARKPCVLKLGQLVEMAQAVYRLSPIHFLAILNILNKRCFDILLERRFFPINFPSFCYFLTLNSAVTNENTGNQSRDLIFQRMDVRLRRYFHRFDIESLGLMCYYLNFFKFKNEKSNFQQYAIRRFENLLENQEYCSHFARKNIEIYFLMD